MIFKRNGSKKQDLQDKILTYLKQAETFVHSNPRLGEPYLKTANELYTHLNGSKKDKKDEKIEEIKLTLESINYAYSNPGEPVA